MSPLILLQNELPYVTLKKYIFQLLYSLKNTYFFLIVIICKAHFLSLAFALYTILYFMFLL